MQIKFICDLPSVLKESIEQNSGSQVYDFENAAQCYSKSIDFLEENKSDAQYAQIANETFECTGTIRKMLWNKMTDDNSIEIVNRYTIYLI